jgi:hypothetical protein
LHKSGAWIDEAKEAFAYRRFPDQSVLAIKCARRNSLRFFIAIVEPNGQEYKSGVLTGRRCGQAAEAKKRLIAIFGG